jgi:hypothetical protein
VVSSFIFQHLKLLFFHEKTIPSDDYRCSSLANHCDSIHLSLVNINFLVSLRIGVLSFSLAMDPVSEAVASYLDPLLKKHTSGHTLVWEDLEAAYNKSISALRSNDNSTISVSDLIEHMNPPMLGLLMS